MMPRDSLSSAAETQSLLLRDEGGPATPGEQGMEDRMRRAEAQLLRLKREREQLEMERRRLEELGDRQRSFAEGRARMCRRLSEAIPEIQEAAAAAQQDVDSCGRLAKVFQHHLHLLKGFHPEEWAEEDLSGEVLEAERALVEAEEQLGVARMRGKTGRPRPVSAGMGGFGFWFKAGLGFFLPFMIFLAGLVAAVYFFGVR
ncbi:MAG TPA: hypothetical protein VMN36_18395 [Verrucomicrobiales bacterium]|nr:hypothetical protein [Verrucomicrobiales bacterium]